MGSELQGDGEDADDEDADEVSEAGDDDPDDVDPFEGLDDYEKEELEHNTEAVTDALQKVSSSRERLFQLLNLVSGAQAVIRDCQLVHYCPPRMETSVP